MLPDLRLSPQALEREVRGLVRFFADWVRGTLPGSEEVLHSQWVARTHPELTVVMPGGALIEYADMEQVMTDVYGSNPDFAVQIRDLRVLATADTQALVLYEEWQRSARTAARPNNGRLTTALLTIEDSPRLRWRHVHQTWLPKELVDAEPFEF